MSCFQVINQVGILLRELCRLHSLPELSDVDRLVLPAPNSNSTGGGASPAPRPSESIDRDCDDDEEEEEENDNDELEDEHFEMEEAEIVQKNKVSLLQQDLGLSLTH